MEIILKRLCQVDIVKNCVWFTEKDETGNTSLYSLKDLNGLNKIYSFQRSYRNGVFGARPKINGTCKSVWR